MSQTAKLSAYYKDSDNKLHHISGVIGITTEGVTEEDVTLFRKEIFTCLTATKVKPPVMIVIQGGKA